MSDSYTKTTRTSYSDNIKNSIGGMVVGVMLFIVSFILLWWNEGNSVRLMQQEDFIKKNAIVVSSQTVNRSNDFKLIATNGKVQTNEILFDGIISMKKALKLVRTVEMYQWVEEKHTHKKDNVGGSTTTTTTYTYKKKWDSKEHSSSGFEKRGYDNPAFPLKSKTVSARQATMGGFEIFENQTSRIQNYRDVETLRPLNGYKIIGNYYYKGKSLSMPEIGDIRISYKFVPSGSSVSIVGMQNEDNTIAPKMTNSGSVYLQYDGVLSLDEMLAKFKKTNTMTTFIARFLGFLLMYGGMTLFVKPIVAVSKFIPILANVIEFTSSLMLAIVAFVLSLITIAIAWLAYRPVLTIILLCVAGIIIQQLKQHIQNKKFQMQG